MKISIFGSGYVGLVQAAIFADVGHRVICADLDEARGKHLKQAHVPFFEPALEGADTLVICTEWKAFWSPDFELIRSTLREPVIIDGRNLYNPAYMEELGIEYYGMGRGRSLNHGS